MWERGSLAGSDIQFRQQVEKVTPAFADGHKVRPYEKISYKDNKSQKNFTACITCLHQQITVKDLNGKR